MSGTSQKLKDNILKGAIELAERRSLKVLAELAAPRRVQVYLVGGTVRELALGRQSPDLDLAVSGQTLELARDLAAALKGTYVLLDEAESTARVVWQGEILDLAGFRAPTLKGDLEARDFTINALALDLEALVGKGSLDIIDPWGGLEDLAQGLIRVVRPQNFQEDPLRLLRAYRFAATHGFRLTSETRAAIPPVLPEFSRVAGERVRQELFTLLAAARAAPILEEMDRTGLLTHIFPECEDMKGVEQDGFHHLDVFHHSLAAVAYLEEVLAAPYKYLGDLAGELPLYLQSPFQSVLLKLAALFHDAGKPQVQDRRTSPDRYTFYYHERVGVELFTVAALRLRFSQAEIKTVTHLITLHMRPFLLLPAFREGELTTRALGRLVRAARADLPGLFALALADSLAGQGPQKPQDSEAVLRQLADAAFRFLKERLEPQERQPRLLTGHDLIKVLGLAPGPRFREILTAVEEAQWEGSIHTRQEALELARSLGRGEGPGT
ncbi:MAG: CCA tRNA nucleotidyltransferase [Thermodesulfobacteriota bacterium]